MKRYGNWTILGDSSKKRYWKCRCDCGNVRDVFSSSITTGVSNSCGCQRGKASITHGLCGSRIYNIWYGMKVRCKYSNRDSWKYYGKRGISICDEWKDAGVFYKWAMENGYRDGLSIERIDVNGNYEPKNCKWITMKEQAGNKRNTLWIEAFGERKTFSEWVRDKRCVVNRATFWLRYKSGIPAEIAMTETSYACGVKRVHRSPIISEKVPQ